MTFVAITVCFRGKLDMTWNLLRQLVEQGGCHVIYAFNNGPSEAEYPWDDVDEIITIKAQDVNLNQMYNEGWELALINAGSDPLAYGTFNNDLELLSDDFIQNLVKGLYSHDTIAAISGTEDVGADRGVWPARCDYGFQGNTMLMKGDLPFRFDEAFRWHWSDIDWLAQAERAGYQGAVCDDAKFVHLGGGSQTVKEYAEAVGYWQAIHEDKIRFYKKWPEIIEPSKNLPL